MKKKLLSFFVITVLVLMCSSSLASRFDWIEGSPAVADDSEVVDTDEGVIYTWVSGIPAAVFDATTPVITQLHYRWRRDDGSESTATYSTAEDTTLTQNVFHGDKRRLRFLISNTGSKKASNVAYRLESASTSCSSWITVPTATSSLSGEHWIMSLSSNILDNTATTDSSGLTNPAGTFVSGVVKTSGNETSPHTLTPSSSQFTELEYSIKPTANATTGTTYCFRVTNRGSTTNFSYSVQPTLTISANARLESGGGGVEGSGTGTQQQGGGTGGGENTEGSGSGTGTSGGGSGGGGDSG